MKKENFEQITEILLDKICNLHNIKSRCLTVTFKLQLN